MALQTVPLIQPGWLVRWSCACHQTRAKVPHCVQVSSMPWKLGALLYSLSMQMDSMTLMISQNSLIALRHPNLT
jgi:hypothetical protein